MNTTGGHMTDSNNLPGIAFTTSAAYFFAGLSFENWIALIGALGMGVSLVLQFLQWNRRRKQETELHEKKMTS